jgi:hypothetical protein
LLVCRGQPCNYHIIKGKSQKRVLSVKVSGRIFQG